MPTLLNKMLKKSFLAFFSPAAPAHPCARGIGASCPAQYKKRGPVVARGFAPFFKHLGV
jgi:hypothetical protein